MVNTDKVFGLFVGITDGKVKVEGFVYANNLLTATITSTEGAVEYTYKLKYVGPEGEKDYNVKAVSLIVDASFNLSGLYSEGSTPATFVYLVAKEEVGYEAWGPASGYGEQRVIIALADDLITQN